MNKKNTFILVFILLLAAFLRLFRISDYLTFLGDEGRDVLVVLEMIVNPKLTLIGPMTSIGNMYLGPAYYYMMILPLALFGFNPIGPAIMIALLGVATVYLIYKLGSFFNKPAGLIAAFFAAISPVLIVQSRSSWNPHPAPFFAALTIYALIKAEKEKNYRWLIVSAISLAFLPQMHYLGILLFPVWFFAVLFLWWKDKFPPRYFLFSIFCLLLFFVLPIVLFDFRHNFLNFKALQVFLSDRQATVSLNPFRPLSRIPELYLYLFSAFVAAGFNRWGILPAFMTLAGLFYFGFVAVKDYIKERNINLPLSIFALWLFWGVFGIGLYKQHLYDHYFGFLFPLPFILFGLSVELFWRKKIFRPLIIFAIVALTVLNITKSPLLAAPARQLWRTKEISRQILAEAGGRSFNLAMLAKQNYDAGYRYFLTLGGGKLYKTDKKITEELYVVCEEKECKPIGHPFFDIASFGWAKVEKSWQFEHITIFKLIHNPEGK